MRDADSSSRRKTHWEATFASLLVILDPCVICERFADSDEWEAQVGDELVAERVPLADAVAAIERELLAVRAAIPEQKEKR